MTVEILDRSDGERELVERARCGDREAFGRLFEQHRPMLTAVCRRALEGRGGVDEVAVVYAGCIVVGSAMLVMARSLSRRRPWAQPVALVALATWTLAIGAFSLSVARWEDAGHGAGYVILGGLALGGLAFAGTLGLATRGAAADFRARKTDAVVLPDPPPPIT